MRYVKIDCMWAVEVNLGQLDRVLCFWSSRQGIMVYGRGML